MVGHVHTLKPLNPGYEPIKLQPDEDFKVLGVFASFRDSDMLLAEPRSHKKTHNHNQQRSVTLPRRRVQPPFTAHNCKLN